MKCPVWWEADLCKSENAQIKLMLNLVQRLCMTNSITSMILTRLLQKTTISRVNFEPCGLVFKDKKDIQSEQPWKQLSLPRLVLLNRWRFIFELLHWCKISLESQAFFFTSVTEAAHQMKGMCEIAFPSTSVSMLRIQTLAADTVWRPGHAAPSDVKTKNY